MRSLLLIPLALLATAAHAQDGPTLARTLGERLAAEYVDPERGAKMRDALEQFARTEEARRLEGDDLAQALESVARSVYDDGHLNVAYSEEPLGEVDEASNDARFRAAMARTNQGFRDVRVLAGNVGYMHIETFAPIEGGMRAVEAAFAMVAETDALVIDVRRSQGGAPEMVAEIVSRLIEGEPRLLNSFDWRNDEDEEYWSRVVTGAGYYGPDRPVYVVIGPRTVSASEAIAYELQALGRARVVGERSAGAANPGDSVKLGDHYEVFMPSGRAVNAITGTNWEGTGVVPDLPVDAEDAAVAAYRAALAQLAEQADEAGVARLRRIAAGDMPTLAPAR